MDLRDVLFQAATAAWMLLVVGAWMFVDAGYAEPTLSFSEIPGGSVGGMAGALVAVFAGATIIGKVRQRDEASDWREAGQQAGLRPADDETPPALTGTVDGRTLTARYERRQRGGSTEGEVRWVPFTEADADLLSPAEAGLIVGTAGGDIHVEDGVGTLDFDDVAETASAADGLVAAETGDLVLVGTSSAAVEAVSDGLSGKALRAIGDLNIVSAGDASDVVARWAEARNEELEEAGSSVVEYPVDNLVERVPGDATTVTVEMQGSIQDGDELKRFAEGVVAIADAFEEATSPTATSA